MLYPAVFIIFCAFVGDVFAQSECILKCPQNCSNSLYQPVCGITKNCTERTFANDCELDRANCQEKGVHYTKIYNTSCANKGCNTSCTNEDKPVCAKNNTRNVTYPNQCIMERDNCLYGYNFTKTSNGVCKNGTCYENYYNPLCAYKPGAPRRTFNNSCELELYNQNHVDTCDAGNYTKIRDGECVLPQLCADCISDYRPRCGCNGTTCRTFNDYCEFVNTNQCYGSIEARSYPYIEVYTGTCDYTGCPDHCNSALVNIPVCGCNGTVCRRFYVECEFVRANCEKPPNQCSYYRVPCNDTIQ